MRIANMQISRKQVKLNIRITPASGNGRAGPNGAGVDGDYEVQVKLTSQGKSSLMSSNWTARAVDTADSFRVLVV